MERQAATTEEDEKPIGSDVVVTLGAYAVFDERRVTSVGNVEAIKKTEQ